MNIIVNPKVKNANEEYDNIIINEALSAVNCEEANYASNDTSKGTIEQRLSAIERRNGAFILSPELTATINTLTREGNFVYGHLVCSMNGTLNPSQKYFELPENFKIKERTEPTYFYCTNINGSSIGKYSGGSFTNRSSGPPYLVNNPDRFEFRISWSLGDVSSGIFIFDIYVGYEATPIEINI